MMIYNTSYISSEPLPLSTYRPCDMERLTAVEIILFEISNSTTPYPSVFLACTNQLRPVIVLFDPTQLDEVSNHIRPTSHTDHAICGWMES